MSVQPSAPERAASHLDTVNKRLNLTIESLSASIRTLREDNDRKLGSIPEDANKKGTITKANIHSGGIVGDIQISLDMLDELKSSLFTEVDRARVI